MNECSPGMRRGIDFNLVFKYDNMFRAILQNTSSKAIRQPQIIAFETNAQGK